MTTEQKASPPDAGRTAVVLLVDDDPQVLGLLERMLSRSHRVETRNTAEEAVARVEQGGVDVVVSDIIMPGMTGLELLRAIRGHEPDLPVILVTGAPRLESATEAIEYGVFRYLEKPVKRRTLDATVEQAFMLYRLARMKREALALLGIRGGASDRAGLEVRFERALEALSVAFQPVVSVSDRSVLGYEALLRTGNLALSGPSEVLDAAERLDAVFRVGRLVRGCAARLFQQAPAESLLFLNLHPRDLTDPELLDEALPLTQMADRVVLEITERVSLTGIDDVQDHVAMLRARGYRVAVDDLGAGQAGLKSFALLQPDVVKIDASLTRNVDNNRMKQKLVASMTSLCEEMELAIVVEGVEKPAERDTLVELGCDLFQGNLFARPGPPFPTARW
jgi:EAL domain-containing protein (putative c-di-GMP-specific phosphodiesterase class I)